MIEQGPQQACTSSLMALYYHAALLIGDSWKKGSRCVARSAWGSALNETPVNHALHWRAVERACMLKQPYASVFHGLRQLQFLFRESSRSIDAG